MDIMSPRPSLCHRVIVVSRSASIDPAIAIHPRYTLPTIDFDMWLHIQWLTIFVALLSHAQAFGIDTSCTGGKCQKCVSNILG